MYTNTERYEHIILWRSSGRSQSVYAVNGIVEKNFGSWCKNPKFAGNTIREVYSVIRRTCATEEKRLHGRPAGNKNSVCKRTFNLCGHVLWLGLEEGCERRVAPVIEPHRWGQYRQHGLRG